MSRGDTFRREYKVLTDVQKERMETVKAKADSLLDELYPPGDRETALAITKLEECVFWATKSITG